MKILLDESLPRKLSNGFGKEHEVFTVRDKKWLGKKNGELFRLITEEAFDLFVTVDRNLQHQQNLQQITFSIVILCARDNRLKTLRLLIPKVFERISQGDLPKVIEIS